MPDAPVLGQFERRLVELGCPARRLRERVRELADHYQDLKLAALEEGLSEHEAAARADLLLGDPVMLAENIVTGLRQASWWGRHPFIGFCLAPPFAFFFLLIGCGWGVYWTWRVLGWILGPAFALDDKTVAILGDNVADLGDLVQPFSLGCEAAAMIVLTMILYRLVERSARGLPWVMAAYAASLVTSLFYHCWIANHTVTIGLGWDNPDWRVAAVPLAAAVLAGIRQRRLENRLAPIPAGIERGHPPLGVPGGRLRRSFLTPTYWIMVILTGLVVVMAVEWELSAKRESARRTELKTKIWPAERAATLALLAEKQRPAASSGETPIPLQPWLNETLAASVGKSDSVKENNLAGLPQGLHTFAGVPFEVAGRAQLLGRELFEAKEKLPERIRNIAIGRKCARLHLLHGARYVREMDKQIAALVLHYRDGSRAEVPIISGRHVLDWWGPIYTTSAGAERSTTAPGSELAWAGSNGWIKRTSPELSLRLYKSTFDNPHPELEIASLDYVSTLTDAAPFLVGLTLEQSTN